MDEQKIYGIITMEDLIEKLTGINIYDESDRIAIRAESKSCFT